MLVNRRVKGTIRKSHREKKVRSKEQLFLFGKSFGGSDKFTIGNRMHGTTGPITCGLCGTRHPEHDSSDWSYHTFVFMGTQGVVECCGAIIDLVFREWGREFAEKILRDFANDPLKSYNYTLRSSIRDAVKAWSLKAYKEANESREVVAALPANP